MGEDVNTKHKQTEFKNIKVGALFWDQFDNCWLKIKTHDIPVASRSNMTTRQINATAIDSKIIGVKKGGATYFLPDQMVKYPKPASRKSVDKTKAA